VKYASIQRLNFCWAPGLAACLMALLSGCSGNSDMQDLRAFMDEVAAAPHGRIAPLPEFKPYEPFKYGAANLRSPFQAPIVIPERANEPAPGSIQPPSNHAKSYLEGFNLASLQLVGSLKLKGQYYGLIRDEDGTIHQVGVDQYIGSQWGKIEKIEEDRLEIVEIVSNGGGGWLLRPRTIELVGSAKE
jgi:type IV pilus assembly protein PilP